MARPSPLYFFLTVAGAAGSFMTNLVPSDTRITTSLANTTDRTAAFSRLSQLHSRVGRRREGKYYEGQTKR